MAARSTVKNNELMQALHAIMTRAAEGREVIPIPRELVAKGPCPYCLHPVDPIGFTFREGSESATPAGIIVCSACSKPSLFTEPGKYLKIPRSDLRRLPHVTQKFIRREQELIAMLKRDVN